jgi:hypothetical protein
MFLFDEDDVERRNKHSDVIPTKRLQNNVHTFNLSTSSSSNRNIICTPNTNVVRAITGFMTRDTKHMGSSWFLVGFVLLDL